MDKQKVLALLYGLVSPDPPSFEDLRSLFLGLLGVTSKEAESGGVKGKVVQLSKAWLLWKPVPFWGSEATVAMPPQLWILKLLILTPREHADSLEGFWCMLDTLITPAPHDHLLLSLAYGLSRIFVRTNTHRVYFWVAGYVSVCDNVYFITWLWGTALRPRPCSHHAPPRACPSVACAVPRWVCGARGHVTELNDIREETDNARDLDLRVFGTLMNI